MMKKIEQNEKIRNYMYYLLGIKDYTEKELKNKVYNKFENIDEENLKEIIDYLKECNYIDDKEYCRIYIRQKFNSGYGWSRIKGDLIYKKEIKEEIFKEEYHSYDWFESAKEIKERRYKDKKFEDYKEKKKAINYLLRRGFSFDEVQYAFEED